VDNKIISHFVLPLFVRLISVGSVESEHGGNTTGGVARTHSLLTKTWVSHPDLGIEVVGVIATNSDLSEDPITGVPYLSRNEGESQAKALTRIIEEYNPDCILLHHIATGWGWSLQNVSHLPKVIGFVHSWRVTWEEYDPNFPKKLDIAKMAIRNLDSLLYHTEHCANEMSDFEIFPNCPIFIVPPPMEMGGFDEEVIISHREHNHIVYLGNLLEHKNSMGLVKAMKSLDDMKLTIIGSGKLENELHDYIINNNLEHRVNLTGFVNDEEMSEIFLKADIFCAPSRYEQFSLVYLEALAHGLPVVGYGPTIDAIRSEMGIECGISLTDYSPKSIHQAIIEVRNQEWDRCLLHNKVRSAFSPTLIAKRFADAINSNQ
jgi:glycosyltransferase involved in cell wall biosynthesis